MELLYSVHEWVVGVERRGGPRTGSLHSPGCLGTHCVGQGGIALTEICLPLPSEVLGLRSVLLYWIFRSIFRQELLRL